jgi:hypothetical protein
MDIDSARELLVARMYDGNREAGKGLDLYGPIYTGHNSRIYRVSSLDLPFDGALKFCLKSRTADPDKEGAQQQFSTLKKVSDAMTADTRYAAPYPIRFFPDDAAYLVEWVSGQNASAGLFKVDALKPDLENIMTESARWLYCFHQGNQTGAGKLDVHRKLTALEQIARHRDSGNRLFARVFDRLVSYAGAASLPELRRSWLHGDFKSDNVIMNAERIVGIDIQAKTENFVVYDIASFINHIDLNTKYLKHRTLRKNKFDLYEKFLTAYYFSRPSGNVMLSVFWARAYMLLMGWCRARQARQGALRTAFLQRQFSSSIDNALRELAWYAG